MMNPAAEGLLTIKEFSQLTHTPVDTLKHYDRINILKPAFTGENKYRYYRPEQALQLTRIIFGVRSKALLSDIKKQMQTDDPQQTINDYLDIYAKLESSIQELRALQNSINNLVYYYNLYKNNPLETIFTIFLPEWFVIFTTKLNIYSPLGNEVNIANNLFIKGFFNNRWPHYLLGAFFDEADIQAADFTAPAYYLKTDYPEQYNPEEIKYIPAGHYACYLIRITGLSLPNAVEKFFAALAKTHLQITGDLFVMDIVNSLITSDSQKYCTMLYARVQETD